MLVHYTNSFQGNTVNEYAGEGFASFWAELLLGDPFSTLNDRLGFSLGGPACGDGASSLAFNYLDDFGTSGDNTLTTTLGAGCGIMLSPGEIFTVATWSQFAANRGGFVDASHTAGLKLSDSLSADQQQNLLSYLVAVSAVPETSTWAMMLLGFGLMGFALRAERQRRRVKFSHS
jgi:hypothetical protein